MLVVKCVQIQTWLFCRIVGPPSDLQQQRFDVLVLAILETNRKWGCIQFALDVRENGVNQVA